MGGRTSGVAAVRDVVNNDDLPSTTCHNPSILMSSTLKCFRLSTHESSLQLEMLQNGSIFQRHQAILNQEEDSGKTINMYRTVIHFSFDVVSLFF